MFDTYRSVRNVYAPTRIYHHGFLQRKYATSWIDAQIEKFVFSGQRVLDYGCGTSRQKIKVESLLGTYSGIDVKETTFGAIFDGKRVPFDSGSFDVVLLNEVLYAIPDSRIAISECHRVLRAGGKLLVSANFIYPLNRETGQSQVGFNSDYYRFTQAGLRELLIPYFEVNSLDQLGGLGSILLLPQYFYRNHLMRHRSKLVKAIAFGLIPVFLLACLASNLVGLLLNKLDSSGLYASDVVAVATK